MEGPTIAGREGRVRKVFIVARGRPDIYASLRRALESEGDVLVIYDRRAEPARERGGRWRSLWSMPDLPIDRHDRRGRPDLDAEIRERGFCVVHLDPYDRYEDDVYDDEDEPLDPLHED